MSRTRVVIMGAAGRDFHNFNCLFRDNPDYEVVAFTATQIPDIEGRTYPSTLAGRVRERQGDLTQLDPAGLARHPAVEALVSELL